MNKAQIALLCRLLETIDPKHEGFHASDEIREILEGPARLYFQSWVYPLIRALIANGRGDVPVKAFDFLLGEAYRAQERTDFEAIAERVRRG